MTRPSPPHVAPSPYWHESASFPVFKRLASDGHSNVVVVGGGITGLTAAYLLSAAGRTVTVLERGRCADVDTGHTTAHLTMVTDTRLSALAKSLGSTHAQAVWDAGMSAIGQIDELVTRHDIACDFAWVDGYLHAPIDAPERDDDQGFVADATLAQEFGFDAEVVADVPLVGGAGIRFEHQARLHPRRYLAGLAKAIVAQGGTIHEHSNADNFSADPLSVKANGHRITCDDIIIATHNPLMGLTGTTSAALFQTKLALYTSYVVAARVPAGSVPDVLLWDTATAYNYLRLQPEKGFDLLILGGEDHKTGQETDTEGCYARLEQRLKTLAPDAELTHRWSGQVIETPDGLPYIGLTAPHQYAATGFSGNGITFGTLSGMMLSDAVLGRSNPWAELFDAGRPALRRGLWDYLKENVDYPYYMLRDRFAGESGRTIRSLKRGQGAVVDKDGQKVAAFRDQSGALSLRSAVCPHMGCLVMWNGAERSWDCPCHGSRFTATGAVISGPSEAPLAELTSNAGSAASKK